jgi:hypothetical protein
MRVLFSSASGQKRVHVHADSEKSTALVTLICRNPSREVMNSSVPGVGSLSRQLELVSRACVFKVVGGGTVFEIKNGV